MDDERCQDHALVQGVGSKEHLQKRLDYFKMQDSAENVLFHKPTIRQRHSLLQLLEASSSFQRCKPLHSGDILLVPHVDILHKQAVLFFGEASHHKLEMIDGCKMSPPKNIPGSDQERVANFLPHMKGVLIH